MSEVDSLVDSLRYRPVATTAAQMRQAADEIERLLAREAVAERLLRKWQGWGGRDPDTETWLAGVSGSDGASPGLGTSHMGEG